MRVADKLKSKLKSNNLLVRNLYSQEVQKSDDEEDQEESENFVELEQEQSKSNL